MPLKFQPDELKFNDFQPMPDKAVADFAKLVDEIAHGTDKEKTVYEDFKTAFGEDWSSTLLKYCQQDLMKGMDIFKAHAAKFVAAFYLGMEKVKKRGVSIPSDDTINKILTTHNVPLAIGDGLLVQLEGDITFVPEDATEALTANGYILGKPFDRGGNAQVYKVTRKTKVGSYHFAMKLLSPHIYNPSKTARARFIREMKILGKLQHRGIVPIIEAGFDPKGVPYILMPLIEGKNVRDALEGAKPPQVYSVFDEVLNALEFAHKKTIHRDLSPKNIMVRKSDGQPLILDFGCAYEIDGTEPTMTRTGIGTPGYVPPEVRDNPKHRDKRHDIYACGVILYECIMRQQPERKNYAPVEKHFPEYAGVDAIIKAALADEDERTESAAEMRKQIRAITGDKI